MLVPIMIQGNWYQINRNKRLLTAVLLTVAGTLGTFLLYFIENNRIGGTSFFGAVFFVPVLFIPVARLLGLRYDLLLDLCAPAECVMLVVMKVQCLIGGCCGGRKISLAGWEFVFPSQLMELVNALIICVVLLQMSRKEKHQGRIYPWYMVIYGISRFILNIGREAWVTKEMLLPFGNIWSLVSIAVGVIWLLLIQKRKQKEC